MTEEITEKEEKEFWQKEKYLDIFHAVLAKKPPKQIVKDLNLMPLTLTRVIRDPIFKERVRKFLETNLNSFEVERALDLPEIYRLIKVKVLQKLDQVSPDTLIREYVKLIPKEERKQFLAEIVKIREKITKKEDETGEITPERAAELKRIFGYDKNAQLESVTEPDLLV